MKYAVLGAGAMGLRYGILLQNLAGKTVDFVDTWEPGIEAVRRQGGVYVSRDHENRHLVPIEVYRPEEYTGDPDVWIIMLKQMQLEAVLKRCHEAGVFKEHQVVFSAMNGWGHFDLIRQYFSEDRIYGGTALVATVLNGPGDVDFIGKSGAGTMTLCSYTGEITEIERQMHADLQQANFNPTITQDLKGTCMAKVVFNSVVNTLCTMYQIQMGQFISYPGAREVARQLIDEAYDALERDGVKLINTRDEELETVDYVSRTGNPLHYPSMYQDMIHARPTEVDYINGYIAAVGRKHGYVCHTHEFLTHGVHLAELAHRLHETQA